MILSAIGATWDFLLDFLWKFLLYIGCGLMGIGYSICSLERVLYTKFDPYGYVFSIIHQMHSLLPSLPDYGGWLYYSSNDFVSSGRKGI